MQIRSFVRLGAVVGVLAIVATACSNSSSSSPGGGSSSSSSEEETTLDVTGKTSAEVEAYNEGSEFYFEPSTLTGSAGQSLTITVKNEGDIPHTFTIDDQNVDVELQPDQEQDVTVAFPDSGSVEFHCRFHVGLGMKGELTVS
jgi:plastocyanin